MPAYDAVSFSPAAPVAEVAVHSPRAGISVENVRMLIDTGADVSLLPRAPIAQVLAAETAVDHFELEGFDGSRSFSPAYHLHLLFLGRRFRGHFLLIDQDCGVLGRNVLNAIPLSWDGPRLTWNEHQ